MGKIELIILLSVFLVGCEFGIGNYYISIKDIGNKINVNQLDLFYNPEKYINTTIKLKNALIYYTIPEGNVISTQEEDGNVIYLRYEYWRTIQCTHVDLYGTIGYKKFDNCDLTFSSCYAYYMNVSRVVCWD